MPNQYYHLWNNSDVLETDVEFKHRIVTFQQMKEDIFDGRSIVCNCFQKIGDGTYLNELIYKNQKYNLLFVNIKNSGMDTEKYKKRLQISNQIDFHNDSTIYVIAGYNVGTERLYCCINITEFVKNAINGKTYSSFWIDYYQLQKTCEKGENIWKDQKNRIIACFSSSTIKSFTDNDLLQKILIDDDTVVLQTSDKPNYDLDSEPVYFSEKVHSYNHKLLPRNSKLKEEALKRANYTCELCGMKKTFSTVSDDQYFEGHHLIMYNLGVQKRYRYCLDNIENIVCLCPTCHKKVHLANLEERKDCVIKLLMKHKKLIEIFEITDIEPIIDDYLKGVKDDG